MIIHWPWNPKPLPPGWTLEVVKSSQSSKELGPWRAVVRSFDYETWSEYGRSPRDATVKAIRAHHKRVAGTRFEERASIKRLRAKYTTPMPTDENADA